MIQERISGMGWAKVERQAEIDVDIDR